MKLPSHYQWMIWGVSIAVIALIGCTNKRNIPDKKTFPEVTIPPIYIDQQAQVEFVVKHYWDKFDFADTSWVGSAEQITEKALVNYISILPYAPYPVVRESMQHLLDQADTNEAMYAFFYSKMEYYFTHPNSNYRNEELYIPLLMHMVSSGSLDEHRKVRPQTILPLLNKNRPGTQATNIHFERVSGSKDSLTNIKAEYILVVFYDFDCEDCNVLKAAIEASPAVKEMQKQKKIAILGIYPGSNVEGWKKSLKQVPALWINGFNYNDEIGREGTYILRTIPTLFLLDKNHMVIMKEPPFEYVEYYLNGVLNPPA